MPQSDWRQSEVSPRLVGGVVVAVVILIAIMACPNKQTPAPSPIADTPAPAQQLGSGDRHAHLRRLISGLAPLIERYEEVGPASVNLYVDATGWNSMSPDQQQQLMDELASKQITRDIGATLHIYVRQTEVGAIGPGWAGEWKFRR